jgi:hypothetical protein
MLCNIAHIKGALTRKMWVQVSKQEHKLDLLKMNG